MQRYKEYTLSLKQVLFTIFGSVAVVSCIVLGVLFFQRVWAEKKSRNERYSIVAVEQKCRSKECLKGVYLSELLDLSTDKPTNLYRTSTTELERRLQVYPGIKKAKVWLIRPSVVFVDYELRHPIATLQDYENMAVDEEGIAFPLHPVFSPKHIPKMILGVRASWGERVTGREMDLALEIIKLSKSPFFPSHYTLEMVDVRSCFGKSANQEVVLEVRKNGQRSYLLRVMRRSYQESLGHFFQLQDVLESLAADSDRVVVDLRMKQLALIKIAG